MKTTPLTRRRFLQGCALAGATCAAVGTGAATAIAAGGDIGLDARPKWATAPSICQGCPAGCAFTGYAVEGKLGKLIGNPTNAASAGTLCARGFGIATSFESASNIQKPMMRNGAGKLEPTTWDAAILEISAALDAIAEDAGPGAIAVIDGGINTTLGAYGQRFAAAIGSDNFLVNDVTRNVLKEAAFARVIGYSSYTPDFDNAETILLIDSSYADVAVPGVASALQKAKSEGRKVIAMDPRMGTLASMADQWIAVNPGTELAAILAICNHLLQQGLYDKAFAKENVEGLEAWAQTLSPYSAKWAEGITGVQSYVIEGLAADLVAAAPAVAIEFGQGTLGINTFSNTDETARAVALLNALLGTYGAKGGALLPQNFAPFSLQAVIELPQDTPVATTTVDGLRSSLGAPFGASVAVALGNPASTGLQAMIILDTNIAYDYAGLKDVQKTLEQLNLVVYIGQQLNETALLADYVLPLVAPIASATLPVFTAGKIPTVAMGQPVVTEMGDAKTAPEIFDALAAGIGVADAFDFSLEEAAAAQLDACGLNVDGLQTIGCSAVEAQAPKAGQWPTESGKIQCGDTAGMILGTGYMVEWVEPAAMSSIQEVVSLDMNFGQGNEVITLEAPVDEKGDLLFNLISGEITALGLEGANQEALMNLAEDYDLDAIWINSLMAQNLGIETGDKVIVFNDRNKQVVTAYVTSRIVPTAVFLANGFGHTSPNLPVAEGVGANPATFNEASLMAGYGTLCTSEALVKLWKEGE